jgi:hypothetical protein
VIHDTAADACSRLPDHNEASADAMRFTVARLWLLQQQLCQARVPSNDGGGRVALHSAKHVWLAAATHFLFLRHLFCLPP